LQLRLSGDDFEGAHHVVGFVFEDVAVVEVSAGVAFEADDDTGDGAGRALNGVLPAKFVGVGCGGGGGEAEFFVEQVKRVYGEERAELASHALWAQVHGLAVLIGAGVLPWEEAHVRLKFNLKIWLDGAVASPGNE